MANGLFLSLPLHGHTNPSLPLVRQLVTRGDQIVYYSTEPFAGSIERTGARYHAYSNAFLADMRQLPDRMDHLAWLLMRTTAEVLSRELDSLRAGGFHYIITDAVAPWGQWVGRLLSIPVVTSVTTFAINRHVAAFGLAHGVRPKSVRHVLSKVRSMMKASRVRRQLCRRYGISGPGVMESVFGRSDLNIVYTSRYFQPCAETFDDRFVFVGPSIAARADVEFPWDEVRSPRIVYASMGTLFNADPKFARMCFEAFENDDVQVILSTGENAPEARTGEAPPNFIVRRFVPQLDVLARASAFVTHGGMNSVSESLYHGVPVVVIPQMGEQAIVGRRAEQLGAGLYLANDDVTPESLRASVQHLLGDSQFREQAARVRESFHSAGGVERAVDAIIAFTREPSVASL